MNKKDIIIARCPVEIGQEHLEGFTRSLREQLSPNDYIIFVDARSDRFDLELVTKPIVVNSSDDLDEQLEHLNSIIKEIRDSDLKEV